jgi:protein-tyrosine phosphatase
VIDLHSHILPGIDDGAGTIEQSLELARIMVDAGTEAVAATPHVRDDYPTSPKTMERLVAQLQGALADHDVALRLLPGGEIDLACLGLLALEDLTRFGLGGNPDYLLLEFPYYGWPLQLGAQVFALRTRRVTPVLAHPERNPDVQAAPDRLRPLVEQGALVQLTAASVDGRLGRRACRCALELLDRGLAHLIATDAHAPELRGGSLAGAVATVGDETLARWLTHDVPEAIVTGTALPPRPEARRRSRRLFSG